MHAGSVAGGAAFLDRGEAFVGQLDLLGIDGVDGRDFDAEKLATWYGG